MNYTDTFINSLSETILTETSESEQIKKDIHDKLLGWLERAPFRSFEEFRASTNIDELADKSWNHWNDVFDILGNIIDEQLSQGNLTSADILWEKGKEMAETARYAHSGMGLSANNLNNIRSSLQKYENKINAKKFILYYKTAILQKAERLAKREPIYKTFNFTKLEHFIKEYNLDTNSLTINSSVLSNELDAAANDYRFNDIDIDTGAAVVATRYLTILATLNILSVLDGVLQQFGILEPSIEQKHLSTRLNGLIGNIKVDNDAKYYNLEFFVNWQQKARITINNTLNALINNDGKAYTFSDLTCSIVMYSTNQSKHFLHINGSGTEGMYNSNIVKATIENLLGTIKAKEALNNEI